MKLPYMMRPAPLITCIVLAACVGEPGVEQSPEGTALQSLDMPWEPDQGTHILGSIPDGIPVTAGPGAGDYLRVSTTPVSEPDYKLSVSGALGGANLVATFGVLQYRDDHSWFVGLKMSTSNGGQIKITAVTRVEPIDVQIHGVVTQAASTLYTLKYRPPVGGGQFGAWTDYCKSGVGAIALRGSYSAARMHRDIDTISFGCDDGIVFKCNFWGYVAGNGGPTTRGWRYHQACTGMGNANYCRTGQSFTRELTPVQIRDDVGSYGHDPDPRQPWTDVLGHPAEMPGDPDTFYIEAGWDEFGGPICLSKIRWAGLPPDPCRSVLPDPRFNPPSGDPEHPKGKFCDDWTMAV